MTKEEILKEIDREIAICESNIEYICDLTATESYNLVETALNKCEIEVLEWVKEMLEK